ncbi:MAG: HTH domain-containing protein [Methanomicrobium sp.]|nr:HTH domain-containing protein [Methanomicrobium sp.]
MKQLEVDKVAEADAGILGSDRMLEKGSEKKDTLIISLLSAHPEITTSEIANELKISTRMVEKYISQLKKDGKIARVGGRKEGHWEVFDELTR